MFDLRLTKEEFEVLLDAIRGSDVLVTEGAPDLLGKLDKLIVGGGMSKLAYNQLYDLIDDATFIKRIKFSLLVAAINAKDKPQTPPSKVGRWADIVLQGKSKVDYKLLGLRILAGVGDNLSDAELQDAISLVVTDLVIAELG